MAEPYYRKTAIIVGVLFITATAAGVLAVNFLPSIDGASEDLAAVAVQEQRILIGSVFIMIMAFACAAIAFPLYPVLKRYNGGLAVAAVGFRVMESIFHLIFMTMTIGVLKLSQHFVQTGEPTGAVFPALTDLFLTVDDWVSIIGLFAFGLGALTYYYIFYRTRLVPRWLALWGGIGIVMMITNGALALAGYWADFSTTAVVMNLPIAVQEMVLAVWLIVKGFTPPSDPKHAGTIEPTEPSTSDRGAALGPLPLPSTTTQPSQALDA